MKFDSILDNVWMIALPENKGVIYHKPAMSSKEAWVNAVEATDGIIGLSTKKELMAKGYRAKKVTIVIGGV